MTNKLFHIQGKLKVRARGYWFTGGGAKGPFGYYPHLKDEKGLPVYPDTQIKGDLRMACNWLETLGHCADKNLITRLFGQEDDSASSLLYLSDLELTRQDKTARPSDIFQVKPRIKIDENTGTVQEHMLVNREMAYLNGRELESELFLGLFQDQDELAKARNLLDRAVRLLSGFGAFRSRGYGMGTLSIEWSEPEAISFSLSQENMPGTFNLVFQSRTHLRSKPIGQGSAQTVEGLEYITPEQFRAWFVNVYCQLFGTWPSLEDMGMLSFSALYPVLPPKQSGSVPGPGYIPPMTTLRRQIIKQNEWDINDVYGQKPDDQKPEHEDMEADPDDDSGLYYGRQKPMDRGWFVTGSEKPAAYRIRIKARSRNSMNEKFITTEDGLFIQEFLAGNTRFCCTVSIDRPESEFGHRASFILKNVPALIKGCVLKYQDMTPVQPAGKDKGYNGPFLVTSPVPFDENFMSRDSNSIKLSSVSGYNSTLKRARRNRICVMPGSILNREVNGQTMPWSGFGKKIDYRGYFPAQPETDPSQDENLSKKAVLPSEVARACQEGAVSRSQAGFLRGLLELDKDRINNILNKRLKKFQDKDKDLKIIYKSIADQKTFEDKKTLIQAILEHMQDVWWKDKQKRMRNECNR